MTSINFIEKRLENLFHKFDDIKTRYEYIACISCHIIEITPLDLFEKDEDYIKFEDEFESQFPGEDILFISENSLNKIDNSRFSLGYNGIDFVEKS